MKIFKVIIAIAVVIVGILGYNYYNDTYVSKDYFVKITETVPGTDELDRDGKKIGGKVFEYDVTTYSKDGKERKIAFDWRGDTAIPKGTWLKVSASKQRVTGQEVIKESDVPTAVQSKF